MRAVGYFRVSSEEQTEGWSLDAQKYHFEEFCQARGWEVAGYYPEEGKSAWTDQISKRPEFRRLLNDAETRAFDVVVVHSLDRFSRNLWVMLDAFRVFSRGDVTFVSIQEQIDYSRPEGRLFLMMLGAFAQYFSDALSRHTRKGLGQRARSGLYHGKPPFGYERCTDECQALQHEGGCHIDEWKGGLVTEVFTRYAGGGVSLRDLARWMNDQGARTNNQRTITAADGTTVSGPQSFTGSSVRWILKNPFYMGKVRYRDEVYQGVHVPLIDKTLFQAVQERLERNRSHLHSQSQAKRDYLLQGLARCVYCGYAMWADTRGRQNMVYYRDRQGVSASNCEYGRYSVPGPIVEEQARAIFSNVRLRSDWKEWLMDRLASESDRKEAMRTGSLLEEKLRRARELYMEGDILREEYRKRKREIEDRLAGCGRIGPDSANE